MLKSNCNDILRKALNEYPDQIYLLDNGDLCCPGKNISQYAFSEYQVEKVVTLVDSKGSMYCIATLDGSVRGVCCYAWDLG